MLLIVVFTYCCLEVLQQNPNVLKTQKIECEPKKDPIEYFFKAIKRLKFKFVSEKDAQYVSLPISTIS